MKSLKNTSGFTLLELMISMTIFAVMSVAIMSVYIQTTNLGQKMRAMRHLSETAREITERIAEDVREKGISLSGSTFDDYTIGSPWNTMEYTGSGGEILGIGDGSKRYVYGKVENGSVSYCKNEDRKNPKIQCGLYVIENQDFTKWWNLVDSFVPKDENKRVKIEDLKFYISGDGVTTEKKVTLVFTLVLMPRIGVPPGLISDTRTHIQTTISERFFKTTP